MKVHITLVVFTLPVHKCSASMAVFFIVSCKLKYSVPITLKLRTDFPKLKYRTGLFEEISMNRVSNQLVIAVLWKQVVKMPLPLF